MRSEDVHAELGDRLGQRAPLELGQRHLGPVGLSLQDLRQRPGVQQPGELELGPQAGDPVTDTGIVEGVGIVDAGGGDQVVELDPHRHRQAGRAHPFVAEGAHGHLPALVLVAEAVGGGHPGIVEGDLAEQLAPGDVADDVDLDPGQLHVDDEGGDPLVLGPALDGGGVGAHEEQSPLGQMGGGDPDLAAVHDVVVAVEHGLGAQVGQVRTGLGLGEALAPVLGGVQDARQPLLLLVLGPPPQDHGPDLPQTVGVVDARRLGPGHDLGVDGVLRHRGFASAPRPGPVDGGPAALVEPTLPGLATEHDAPVGVVLVADLALGGELGQVRVEPRLQLLAEFLVLGGGGEIHGVAYSAAAAEAAERGRPRTSGLTMWRGVTPARRRTRSSAMVWVPLASVS